MPLRTGDPACTVRTKCGCFKPEALLCPNVDDFVWWNKIISCSYIRQTFFIHRAAIRRSSSGSNNTNNYQVTVASCLLRDLLYKIEGT